MSNPIVEVKHLSHRYSVDWAIRDINFSIEKTGILGLLGSNGAGKSTTMNIICGVLNQTEGDVFINGIDLRKIRLKPKTYWFPASKATSSSGLDCRRILNTLCHTAENGQIKDT